jgi:type I restriction enzyme S subunit
LPRSGNNTRISRDRFWPMHAKLPKRWVSTTLGEVCAMNPRMPFNELPPDHTLVSFVPMAAVAEETGRLDASQTRTLASVRRGYTPFKENDVIFAKITPCMENGKIALATNLKNGLAYGSTEFFVFRPYGGLLPRFVLYFLLQPSLREDAERHMTGAVGQKRVPANYLFKHQFSLPPTREQERIVAKLDATLSGLERAEIAARRAHEKLRRYRAAVLFSNCDRPSLSPKFLAPFIDALAYAT